MRSVVKDPVSLRPPGRDGQFPDRLPALLTLRVGVGLLLAATAAAIIGDSEKGLTLPQFLVMGAFFALANLLAESVLPKSSGKPGLGSALQQPNNEDKQDNHMHCAMDHPNCSVFDAMRGLLTAALDTTVTHDVSEVTNILVRKVCDLSGADAAWVFELSENPDGPELVSSHLHPSADRHWEDLSERARHFAIQSIHHMEHSRRGASHQFEDSEPTDYLLVHLAGPHRAFGVLVAHFSVTQSLSADLRRALISFLASQAVLSLENSMLNESQLDVEAKIKQFSLHRADYAATLSHELRTPLTSIKGFAQLLTRDQPTSLETLNQYARTIAAEADKLALIVNDVVDLTRMETGLLQMHRKPTDPGQLVQRVVDRVQPYVPSQPIRTSAPERVPPVRVDPDRLVQVLDRLVVDAVRQSAAGSSLLLAVEAREEDVTIRLEYQATEAHLDSLIQALKGPGGSNQQAGDGQATQLGRGRLGLYICRNFIEAHGGKMWIEQPEDQVVRVVFTLPY